MPKRHHPAHRCHPRPRALPSHARAHYSSARQVDPRLRERANIVARLAAASQALPDRPDIAALLLDGALNDMLAVWLPPAPLAARDEMRYTMRDARSLANALDALDQRAPAISARLRLAAQAHDLAARLAHCWALLDLLTTETAPTTSRAHIYSLLHEPIAMSITNKRRSPDRKDG